MATVNEKYFGEAIYGSALYWMRDNLEPIEVFDKSYLAEWIKDNMEPGEIFDDEVLVDWALDYGMKEE